MPEQDNKSSLISGSFGCVAAIIMAVSTVIAALIAGVFLLANSFYQQKSAINFNSTPAPIIYSNVNENKGNNSETKSTPTPILNTATPTPTPVNHNASPMPSEAEDQTTEPRQQIETLISNGSDTF